MSRFSRTKTKILGTIDGLTSTPGEEVLDEADEISLQRIDEAAGAARPAELGKTYLEEEFDERAEEQVELHTGEGEKRSRLHASESKGLRTAAEAGDRAVKLAGGVADTATEQYENALKVLSVFVIRGPKQKLLYWIFLLVLLLGDVVGIAGAAIYLGEIPTLAFLQAVSVGAAAVASGFLSADLKELRLASERRKEKLTDAEKPYAHLFSGGSAGRPTVKLVLCSGLVMVVLIAGGVTALRSSTEGSSAGVVFGCLAAAVALGSWANTYAYADRIADFLDHLDRRARSATKRLLKLSQNSARFASDKHASEAASIQAEHKALGAAAKRRVTAAKFRGLRNSPGVVGHGAASQSVAPAQIGTIEGLSSNGEHQDRKSA